jgi:hypothetical protein
MGGWVAALRARHGADERAAQRARLHPPGYAVVMYGTNDLDRITPPTSPGHDPHPGHHRGQRHRPRRQHHPRPPRPARRRAARRPLQRAIRALAAARHLPLMDYWRALQALPRRASTPTGSTPRPTSPAATSPPACSPPRRSSTATTCATSSRSSPSTGSARCPESALEMPPARWAIIARHAPPRRRPAEARRALRRAAASRGCPLLQPVIEAQRRGVLRRARARQAHRAGARAHLPGAQAQPPERWKVVVFGQSPYPRVESATGIAMFDNAFQVLARSRVRQGRVTMRCMHQERRRCGSHKAARGHARIAKDASLLADKKHGAAAGVVPGDADAGGAPGRRVAHGVDRRRDEHRPRTRGFWAAVVEAIVEEILRGEGGRGPRRTAGWCSRGGGRARAGLRTRSSACRRSTPR